MVKRYGRALIGVFSALILLLTGISAVTVYSVESRITTIDTGDALVAPSAAPTAPQTPQNPSPAPTEAPPASEPPTAPTAAPIGDPINFLLIGSDTRQGQGNGYGDPSEITGERSDTTILIHLNGNRDKAVAISIPRDLWMTLPKCRTGENTWSPAHEGRFNEAFSLGGAECTIRAVTAATGLPVNHVIIVDFASFQQLVDAAGGLTICTTQKIEDEKSGLSLTPGTHTLNGKEALALARTRYSLGDGSDISRMGRQQQIIKLFINQLRTSGTLQDPATLYALADIALSSLTMDPDLASLPVLTGYLTTMIQMNPDSIQYLTWPWIGRADQATVETDETRADPIVNAILTDQLPLPKKLTPAGTSHAKPTKTCKNPIN
jgi:LCP family protein required for cell wall assembly